MALLARLNWLQQQVERGHEVTVHFSWNAATLKDKVRFCIGAPADHDTRQPTSVLLTGAIQMVSEATVTAVVVDRGHKFSSGKAEICFWIQRRNPSPEPGGGSKKSSIAAPSGATCNNLPVGTSPTVGSTIPTAPQHKAAEVHGLAPGTEMCMSVSGGQHEAAFLPNTETTEGCQLEGVEETSTERQQREGVVEARGMEQRSAGISPETEMCMSVKDCVQGSQEMQSKATEYACEANATEKHGKEQEEQFMFEEVATAASIEEQLATMLEEENKRIMVEEVTKAIACGKGKCGYLSIKDSGRLAPASSVTLGAIHNMRKMGSQAEFLSHYEEVYSDYLVQA